MDPSWGSLKPDGAELKKKNAPLLKCPRCDSTNTKFCYFNNYSRAQPRHFCRACCRYWTEGGTLRNVPIGGIRKNKRRKIAPVENSSFAISAGNPAPNISLVAKGEPEHASLPDTLCQVLHSLPASLKLPAVYTVDELIGAPMPHISQTFMEDFSGGFVCSGGSSPFAAASSYSSSSQYSYRGRDVVGGYEDSFLGMMNSSTDISLVNEQTLLPASNWKFWHDSADFADPSDGSS